MHLQVFRQACARGTVGGPNSQLVPAPARARTTTVREAAIVMPRERSDSQRYQAAWLRLCLDADSWMPSLSGVERCACCVSSPRVLPRERGLFRAIYVLSCLVYSRRNHPFDLFLVRTRARTPHASQASTHHARPSGVLSRAMTGALPNPCCPPHCDRRHHAIGDTIRGRLAQAATASVR